MIGRALYDVGAPDELAHWLAQHPHIVMLAASSQLDTYLDTGAGALLQQGQLLRIRRRDGVSDAMLRDLASDTTFVEEARDGCLPDGGTIDALVRSLAIREPLGTVRTVLTRNFTYWDKVQGNLDEVVFTPIGNDATRVAALLSGEIDVMEPVPLQDVERIKTTAGYKVLQGPELRTIFLGMDQKRDELLFSNVKGKNPFKDKRVRQAFYQAIDTETIKSRVMRGAATPTALMIAPAVRGFQPDMNKRAPYDVEAAKRLLADAGYPNGFEVGMNCPNDRYVNDAAICQAVAANLARIGVKINLTAETKVSYFPKILRRDTSFYLLGWTPSTTDAHDALYNLMASPTDKGQGQYNLGVYNNPKLDELALKVQTETDKTKRGEMIREAFKLHQDDFGHIPLHQQALAWGYNAKVSLVQLPTNYLYFKWVTVKAK